MTKPDFDAKLSSLKRKITENKELKKLKTSDSSYFRGKSHSSAVISDNSLTRLIDYLGNKKRIRFTESCLKQPKLQYTHRKIVNIYLVYELGASGSNNNDPTLKNCLFGAVTVTKNADIDKYECSGYGIEVDKRPIVSFPGGGFGQNVLIFGTNMSSSAHIDNNKKDILVLRKGPTQGYTNIR